MHNECTTEITYGNRADFNAALGVHQTHKPAPRQDPKRPAPSSRQPLPENNSPPGMNLAVPRRSGVEDPTPIPASGCPFRQPHEEPPSLLQTKAAPVQ